MENPSYYLPGVVYNSNWRMVQPVTNPGGKLTVMPIPHVLGMH